MSGTQSASRSAGLRWARAALIASALLALGACDQFDADKTIDSCVESAIRHEEPFGNAKERAQARAQFQQYCASAVTRQRP